MSTVLSTVSRGTAVTPKSGPSMNRYHSKQDHATPPGLLRVIEERFGPIAFDLAAAPHNKKHYRYFSEADNSLVQDWHKTPGNLWLNPPFGSITPWAEKCWLESQKGAKILLLVPASIGTNWFRDFVYGKSEVLALNGRVKFLGPDMPAFPKELILCRYGFGTGFDVWTWPDQDKQWCYPLLEDVV